jgi:hypothetical protein
MEIQVLNERRTDRKKCGTKLRLSLHIYFQKNPSQPHEHSLSPHSQPEANLREKAAKSTEICEKDNKRRPIRKVSDAFCLFVPEVIVLAVKG